MIGFPRVTLALCAVVLLGAADAPKFRFTRAIDAKEGWSRIDLPDDVLAAARPGLPDLRVIDAQGSEVVYARTQAIDPHAVELPLLDLEMAAGRETTAIVDRGASPGLVDTLDVKLWSSDFLKPIAIEASDDRLTWREIAHGSIFSTDVARATSLRFAPNDRRYLRLRFDDRNGAPLMPTGVGLIPVNGAPSPRSVPLALQRLASENAVTTWALALPSANLVVSRIELSPKEPVFTRPVTVYERVLFRGELTRRVVGGGVITRDASGGGVTTVRVGGAVSSQLEIDVDEGGSPALDLGSARAVVEPRAIVFFVRPGQLPVSLAYGAPGVLAPRYDMERSLGSGAPKDVAVASLGAPVDHGATPGLPAEVTRGAVVDPAAWKTRAPIQLPAAGSVAYLTLDDLSGFIGDLRVIDAERRQVPYVFEHAARTAKSATSATVTQVGTRTVASIGGLAMLASIDGVELTADAPSYFTRSIAIVETTRDARGPTGERVLGSATWERRAGDAIAPLSISISAPSQPSIEVRIENGDNAPISLGHASVMRTVRRVDFVFKPGETLSLLRGNDAAMSPSYDLALVADAVLSAPAEPATLGAPLDNPSTKDTGVPKWFWACVVAAGLLVGAVLARTLKAPPPA